MMAEEKGLDRQVLQLLPSAAIFLRNSWPSQGSTQVRGVY
jgi:hypothetical protein